MEQFKGRVVLVTGGASGIGKASALAFAKRGAKVVVADVAAKEGEETIRMINDSHGEAIFVKMDVSKSAEIEKLINKTVESWGRLDYAHNNAGIMGIMATTADCTEENWDRTISINLKGVWLCMKYEIQQMLKQGNGVIVNTSSSTGLVGFKSFPAYSASKFGVIGLTKTAALEYGNKNIRINALCPGAVNTGMINHLINVNPKIQRFLTQSPIGRMGQPEEIGEVVAWLCSDESSFVTGHAMVVDGGMTAQ